MPEAARINERKESAQADVEPLSPAKKRNITVSNLVVGALTLIAALWGVAWLYDRLSNVYVLDAHIASDMVLLSSRVPGWVVSVQAMESASYTVDETLLIIDPRSAGAHRQDLELEVGVLDAEIKTVEARRDLVSQRTHSHQSAALANLDAMESALSTARSDFEIATADWQRADSLRERNLLSQQDWEAGRNTLRGAQQTVRRREAEVASAKADLEEVDSERAEVAVFAAELSRLQQQRLQALRQSEQAQNDLMDHTTTSPINGIVDELFVDPGEYVVPGQRLLLMHNPARTWVKANVKETDIRYLSVGKQVSLRVDAYPNDERAGTISRIGNAATSQFALLPNPNPSGNFTKIAQRLEVVIEIEQFDPLLKPGMMVEVKIPHGP